MRSKADGKADFCYNEDLISALLSRIIQRRK